MSLWSEVLLQWPMASWWAITMLLWQSTTLLVSVWWSSLHLKHAHKEHGQAEPLPVWERAQLVLLPNTSKIVTQGSEQIIQIIMAGHIQMLCDTLLHPNSHGEVLLQSKEDLYSRIPTIPQQCRGCGGALERSQICTTAFEIVEDMSLV